MKSLKIRIRASNYITIDHSQIETMYYYCTLVLAIIQISRYFILLTRPLTLAFVNITIMGTNEETTKNVCPTGKIYR